MSFVSGMDGFGEWMALVVRLPRSSLRTRFGLRPRGGEVAGRHWAGSLLFWLAAVKDGVYRQSWGSGRLGWLRLLFRGESY
jgi:hypothetical protein